MLSLARPIHDFYNFLQDVYWHSFPLDVEALKRRPLNNPLTLRSIRAPRKQIEGNARGSKGARGLTVGPYRSTNSRILQFHRDQASDSGEVVTPFMQDGTYPTRNFATLEPILLTAAVKPRKSTSNRSANPLLSIWLLTIDFYGFLLGFKDFCYLLHGVYCYSFTAEILRSTLWRQIHLAENEGFSG